MGRKTTPRTIKSVDTACRILRILQERGGVTVTEMSEKTGLSTGSVHTHLATLKQHGLVTQHSNEYQLGMHLVPLGERVKSQSELYWSAKDEIDQTAKETGECVHLIVESDSRSVILYEAFGDNAVGTSYHIRSRGETPRTLHTQAAGKAILAHLSEERVEGVIRDQGLPALTNETVTDKDNLYEQLKTIRSRGYAVNDEEEVRGIRAVGAPILRTDGTPWGAVSLTAPSTRLKGTRFEEEIPQTVVDITNIIEINLDTSTFERSQK